jgi:hypothetical protein
MPNGTFTVADVLDRGLAAEHDTLLDVSATDGGADPGIAARFRDVIGSAQRTPELAGFFDAVSQAQDPQATATAFINAKYGALGGAAGVLGPTVAAVSMCPDGIGWFRHFRDGSIYWHPALGAHECHGPVRAKWASLGWERSFLGYPVSDEVAGDDPAQRGVFGRFQGGMILWHPAMTVVTQTAVELEHATVEAALRPVPSGDSGSSSGSGLAAAGALRDFTAAAASADLRLRAVDLGRVGATTGVTNGGTNLGSAQGAYEVHGAIGAHYAALGGSGSVLGYPVTDESGAPDSVGRFNHFEAGSIYWTPATGAHEVHGLIRQLWAQNGWERNASLGYPISDELIPDRRIGHRHPERLRKPVLDLPPDVIKLPAEATRLGFSSLVSNVSATTRSSLAAEAPPQSERVAVDRSVGVAAEALLGAADRIRAVSDVSVGAALLAGQSSSPASEASQNRFGDFESGVLFWRRGATAAQQLQPWLKGASGESMRRSAADVIQAVQPQLGAALGRLSGASLAGLSFAGTTGYSWDGVSVRNRRHRVTASLMATQQVSGVLGITTSVPTEVAVELLLEVSFQPIERVASVCLADWVFAPSVSTVASPPLARQLHTQLDPLLFHLVSLIELPDTDDGRPIAILSVKTMPNGDVVIFIEPSGVSLGGVIKGTSSVALINELSQDQPVIPQ